MVSPEISHSQDNAFHMSLKCQ